MTVPGKAEGTLIKLCDQDPGQAQASGLPGAGAHLGTAQAQGVHHHGEVQAVGGAQQEQGPTLYPQWHFPAYNNRRLYYLNNRVLQEPLFTGTMFLCLNMPSFFLSSCPYYVPVPV